MTCMVVEEDDVSTWPQWKSQRRIEGCRGRSLWRRIGADVFGFKEEEDNEKSVCVRFDNDGDKSWEEGDKGEIDVSGDEWEVEDGIGIGISLKPGDTVGREVEVEELDGVGVEKGNVFSWKTTSRLVKNCRVVRL